MSSFNPSPFISLSLVNLKLVYLFRLSISFWASLIHSYLSSPEVTGVCLHDKLFTWLLGMATEVLLLV